MEKEGILVRRKGEKDARQMIVSLTDKGWNLQEKLVGVPYIVGGSVLCESITPETTPDLFRMLDGIIAKLSAPSTLA
jgi:DNA-binding MarR family transcriptional regulator